jgi:hypothetical protein
MINLGSERAIIKGIWKDGFLNGEVSIKLTNNHATHPFD